MIKKTSTRFIVLSALMLFGNATNAFADAGGSAECNPKPKCKVEPVCPPKPCPPKPCCEPVCCPPIQDDCCKRNVCPPTGTITPRVDLVKGEGMDWFVTGDYTYWTARENSTEFAVVNSFQGSSASPETDPGKAHRLDNKWVSGFKAGLGTDFCHDGWDLYAEYTWFKSTNSKTLDGFPAQTLVNAPPVGVPLLFDGYWDVNNGAFLGGQVVFGSADAEWRVNMNVVDLELGRNFYVSPRLMLRPFYGLKGAWNKQHMDVSFTGVNGQGTSIVNSMENKIKNWGIGVRAGMDTSWHFTRCFSIIGDMAFTGLWEEFKTHRFDSTATAGVVTDSTLNVKENQYMVAPIIEWMLGLKWETGLSCDDYHLSIAAAWEQQVWFGQNKFFRDGNTIPNAGDTLTLQGLTVDVRFDF